MQRRSISIAITILALDTFTALVGCGAAPNEPATASPKPASTESDPSRPPPLTAPDKREAWKGRDATVYEIPSLKLLEVIATSEAAGVDAEYQWLRTQRCGVDGTGTWTTHEQSLLDRDGRQYDVLRCVCSTTGEPHDFVFDITQYFGIDLR